MLVLISAVAACGGSSDEGTGEGVTTPGDVIRSKTTGDVVVRGSILVEPDGTMVLCDGFRESSPPTCVGDQLVVEGLDEADVPGLHQPDGSAVAWSDRVLRVRGTASGRTLRADSVTVA